jgi:FAD/FMN-containing dehydrogenase
VDRYAGHARKIEKLAAQLTAIRSAQGQVRLRKSTSNLFRNRGPGGPHRLDARALNRVLYIDPRLELADVEGMTPYDVFVDETLARGFLPAVVPQLKSITVGGAVSGIGIESSSFRFGLVHETVEEMEILLGDGRVVVCSPARLPDLFFGFANSYGTLGYALRLTVRLIPARPYVRIVHRRFSDSGAFFAAVAERCAAAGLNYLDGTVFSAQEMYLTEGEFCDRAPRLSDYTWMRIYYESISRRPEDWLTARDYIWRWDTDWFWCSKQFFAQNPVVRFCATKWLLHSRTWQRIMHLAQRLLPDRGDTESVIQDVDVPLEQAPEFLRFLLREVRITPVWICPFQARDPSAVYPLFALPPGIVYVNFGFWDVLPTIHPPGYFNRLVEQKLVECGGKKGLYSSVYFDEDTFWSLYGRPAYQALKARYDPHCVFPDLYAKCARPQS